MYIDLKIFPNSSHAKKSKGTNEGTKRNPMFVAGSTCTPCCARSCTLVFFSYSYFLHGIICQNKQYKQYKHRMSVLYY